MYEINVLFKKKDGGWLKFKNRGYSDDEFWKELKNGVLLDPSYNWLNSPFKGSVSRKLRA